jgi:hypothetical protein
MRQEEGKEGRGGSCAPRAAVAYACAGAGVHGVCVAKRVSLRVCGVSQDPAVVKGYVEDPLNTVR